MKELKVEIEFLQSVLGTATGDKEVYRNFIASKSPDAATIEEEIEAIGTEGVIEKGKTFFPRNEEGKPFIYDYQIRGFLKSALGTLSKIKGNPCEGVKAYKKKIDTTIFIKDRENVIYDYNEITECQRPLRCSTMQGERVSIAISEQIPAGAKVQFTIQCLDDSDIARVRAMLDYGRFNGLLQWRNSGHGSFAWKELEE